MKDLYLRCHDWYQLNSILIAAKSASANASNHQMDIIGVITKETGKLDADGIPVSVPVEGFHANVRLVHDDPAFEEALASITIAPPMTPYRTWA